VASYCWKFFCSLRPLNDCHFCWFARILCCTCCTPTSISRPVLFIIRSRSQGHL